MYVFDTAVVIIENIMLIRDISILNTKFPRDGGGAVVFTNDVGATIYCVLFFFATLSVYQQMVAADF